jgi:hypothetical protein
MLQLRYMGVICVIWYKIFTVFQNYWGGPGPPWPPLVSATVWDTSPMLYQLTYMVKSVRVDDISELSIVPSISVYSMI